MAHLILVRHGRSEWNDKGLWTGLTDISLNDVGRGEARATALAIRDLSIDVAFSSSLKRAKETLSIILTELNIPLKPEERAALNERNYGVYTGKNKWEVKEEVGEETFTKLRRSWDHPIPEGESLKKVFERVVPFFKTEVLPHLNGGKNVILAAHGNSLRALVKHLENISDEEISELEIKTAEAFVYNIGKNGQILSKELRSKNSASV